MNQLLKTFCIALILAVMISTNGYAQFEEPELVKVESANRAEFLARFNEIKWTGQGFNYNELDRVPTIEIRAKLQRLYGEPTKKVEDNINTDGYLRPGKAVQFEYWFIVDGKYPLMILDLDGPFDDGLVYVGASRYIDLMPQVKRSLTKSIMEAQPEEFTDYFFSPEREQWYKVSYKAGEYKKEEIDDPKL